MPELSLNRDQDVLFVADIPGTVRRGEIQYPSPEATIVIEEAAEEIGKSSEAVLGALLEGKTVDF